MRSSPIDFPDSKSKKIKNELKTDDKSTSATTSDLPGIEIDGVLPDFFSEVAEPIFKTENYHFQTLENGRKDEFDRLIPFCMNNSPSLLPMNNSPIHSDILFKQMNDRYQEREHLMTTTAAPLSSMRTNTNQYSIEEVQYNGPVLKKRKTTETLLQDTQTEITCLQTIPTNQRSEEEKIKLSRLMSKRTRLKYVFDYERQASLLKNLTAENLGLKQTNELLTKDYELMLQKTIPILTNQIDEERKKNATLQEKFDVLKDKYHKLKDTKKNLEKNIIQHFLSPNETKTLERSADVTVAPQQKILTAKYGATSGSKTTFRLFDQQRHISNHSPVPELKIENADQTQLNNKNYAIKK